MRSEVYHCEKYKLWIANKVNITQLKLCQYPCSECVQHSTHVFLPLLLCQKVQNIVINVQLVLNIMSADTQKYNIV